MLIEDKKSCVLRTEYAKNCQTKWLNLANLKTEKKTKWKESAQC